MRRLFLVLLAAVWHEAAAVDKDMTADRPNILYVILEDAGPNFGCYGEPLVRTPRIDAFAKQSVRFTNAFATAPVCSVSRSAIMTGNYPMAFGAENHRTAKADKKPLAAPMAHVAEWFRRSGYYTCNLRPEGGRGRANGASGSGKLDLNFLVAGPRANDPFDGRDWQERADGQPFFAHLTITESHKGDGWTLARNRDAAELVDPEKLKLPPYYPDHPVARDEYANYLDALQLVDGYVGEVLDRLEREGLDRNTIVVVSSDHGPLFRGKQFLYDNGLRIPLLVRFPDGRGAGTVDDCLVGGIDLAPTMLGFAGIRPPAGAMRGIDVLHAPRQPQVFAERDRMDGTIDRMRAVRTERYKYIRNDMPQAPYMQRNGYKEKNYPTWNLVKQLHREGKLTPEADLFAAETKPAEELYDITDDPHEVRNLALDPAHKPVLDELRTLVSNWTAAEDRSATVPKPASETNPEP
jgi:N-sulfoglucosamine sulfohydrolase